MTFLRLAAPRGAGGLRWDFVTKRRIAKWSQFPHFSEVNKKGRDKHGLDWTFERGAL
ncbi:MAG: hypothetical protein RLZ97_1356 [Verrucomicrobiota bacterium]|jgi:hypothetical protein